MGSRGWASGAIMGSCGWASGAIMGSRGWASGAIMGSHGWAIRVTCSIYIHRLKHYNSEVALAANMALLYMCAPEDLDVREKFCLRKEVCRLE